MKLDVQNPQIWFEAAVNPFAAPACNISGLKDAGTRLQTVYFPVL